jgi:hypothetical protein
MSAKLRMIARQLEFEVGIIYSTAPYIIFVQGFVTKARDGLSAYVDQYAREIEESEGHGSLRDGAMLFGSGDSLIWSHMHSFLFIVHLFKDDMA